jgi:hypothetical protein
MWAECDVVGGAWLLWNEGRQMLCTARHWPQYPVNICVEWVDRMRVTESADVFCMVVQVVQLAVVGIERNLHMLPCCVNGIGVYPSE